MSSPTDEADLLGRLQQGDRAAFAQCVAEHQQVVWRMVWRYVRNDADASDLTQAAFVRAWQSAPQFRGDASIRSWLVRIACNLALNHLRDRGRWRGGEVEPDTLAAGDPDAVPAFELLAERESQAQLRAAVAGLPAKQRLVVELRVQEELSFREVADAAECSEDAAKANFHHAMKRLRSLLGGRSAGKERAGGSHG
jgi:RNA polymerase sigma-70 factor (ECF subfamily)